MVLFLIYSILEQVRATTTGNDTWDTILNISQRHNFGNKLRAQWGFYTAEMNYGENLLSLIYGTGHIASDFKYMEIGIDYSECTMAVGKSLSETIFRLSQPEMSMVIKTYFLTSIEDEFHRRKRNSMRGSSKTEKLTLSILHLLRDFFTNALQYTHSEKQVNPEEIWWKKYPSACPKHCPSSCREGSNPHAALCIVSNSVEKWKTV